MVILLCNAIIRKQWRLYKEHRGWVKMREIEITEISDDEPTKNSEKENHQKDPDENGDVTAETEISQCPI